MQHKSQGVSSKHKVEGGHAIQGEAVKAVTRPS